MRRVLLLLVLGSIAAPQLAAQGSRIASDFELAQMERQLADARGFEAALAARLNLGDVRMTRGEPQLARVEYQKALELAERERQSARLESALTRYAHATSYAGLANAKLGNASTAFALLEEALRYGSDDAETWNLYASAMRRAGQPRKAISAARNAVTIAARERDPLDLGVYEYALATALIEDGKPDEAESLLESLDTRLHSDAFRALRAQVARSESFEVYSSARGDVAAFVSLLNRTQLRLGALYESRGATTEARETYARVLQARSDDATALTALARLASREADRERHYEAAFDANPFASALIHEYRRHLRQDPVTVSCNSADCTTGTAVRSALGQLERGELRAARRTLDTLLARFPSNETLQSLRDEADGAESIRLPSTPSPSAEELNALLEGFERLTPEQRVALDGATFTSSVAFDTEGFAKGEIEGVAFRFAGPVAFAGTFAIDAPLRLTYRILGVTRADARDSLMLEPLRLEQGS